jgi:two-component system, NtrC family, response regulator AtoC
MGCSPAVLVTSSHLEPRRTLVHMLEDLGVNTFTTSSLAEACDVLEHQSVALVFCDESLQDGSYRNMLQIMRECDKSPHVVVTSRTGEWPEYLEAVKLGAFDLIQYPYMPTDVELNVIRALRDAQGEIA